jgi:tetratricopeptide (TPR) repeat protein
MQVAAQQALGFVRRSADGLKAALYEAAPGPFRDLVDATPSLVLLLGVVFVGLVALQIVLSLLFRRKRRRRSTPTEVVIEPAPPLAREAPRQDTRQDTRQDARQDQRAAATPKRVSRAVGEPAPLHDPRPGIEAATRRGENGLMLGDLIAARASFEEAERTARSWARAAPGQDSYKALIRALLRLAETRQKAGDVAGAWRAADEAVSTVRLLLVSQPNDPNILRELAVALERAGGVAAASGDKHAARRAWEEELHIAGRLAQAEGADPSWLRFMAVVHVLVGNLGEADAFTHYDMALRCFDQCAQAGALTATDAATREQLRTALRRV